MSSYDLLTLTDQIFAIGKGSVFYGTGAFAGSGNDLTLTHLGLTEGDIDIEANEEYSTLTLPDNTGPAPIEKYFDGAAPVITMPIIAADPALRAITSPVGTASGGYERRRSVTEYTLVVFPEEVFIEGDAQVTVAYTTAGGWTVGGDAATTEQLAQLDLSFWAWRGHFSVTMPMFRHDDGGKVVQTVEFHIMQNFNMPQGHQLWTIGRPEQASPTAIEIAAA